jgi:hypothetical protein
MSIETIVLLSNASNDTQPLVYQYSDKGRGSGYYKNGNGIHTVVFTFDNFKGSVKIQATLELHPGDNDWFDVIYDSNDVDLASVDSTPLTNNATCTFTGKFVFIRAAYLLEQGTISKIQYNC